MKNILVPTDFSVYANYAVDAAYALAKKFNTTVHIFHNINLPTHLANLTEEEQASNKEVLQIKHNAEILLQHAVEKLKGVNTYPIVQTGKLVTNVQEIVKEKAIDMIVMGSHGASGKNEFFVGSNTQKVVRMVHCPVLVLKNPLVKLDFNKVIYASSFNDNERASFFKFKNFIKHFLPEIHLLTINTSEFFGAPYVLQKAVLDDCAKLCAPLKVRNHIYRDFTIAGGIQNFVNKINADLLVVSNRHRRPLKRMLLGSNVEALVNHVDIPVLSIDYDLEPLDEAMRELNNLQENA